LGKLKIFSGQEVCQILLKHGFHEVRRKGRPIIMQKQITGSAIIRQSIIQRSDFK
jgi:predicted RNA binding protein YcfA (HicA-like mRNA interferase family)